MGRRALVVYAHPCEESFAGALHAQTVAGLSKGGWEVDDCDLYAEGFSPVLTAEERRNYHNLDVNTLPVQGYVDRLRAADALILVFPVWNMYYPAMLKGFFDRVYLPGVSFKMQNGVTVPALSNIRKLGAVCTYGGARWKARLAGDPPRRAVMRAAWGSTRLASRRFLALYDMNRATEVRRKAFLGQVGQEMETF
ncbi:NAD(P)H-dependent oxidoreductase [Pseudooceanicola sp. CBS1P-1]|uniref:Flavodoxin family protein n=1 Tax=Pseudooceanicola albus TaxID=2692189 RepID=A0A6L7G678_9RHOB|nr:MULTISPECIES: NAD(P)H-dependent oxidoreductase [Pseudooceanicola]MBT9382994.1 NAD(P)H-dependent oxidoreductase [Pseudooceanicola endophyticus]MXN19182.1 flavodoxin family protein [Pseudooceanicola albus]